MKKKLLLITFSAAIVNTSISSTSVPVDNLPTSSAGTMQKNTLSTTVSAPISLNNQRDVVIKNRKISNPNGPCIVIYNSNNVVIEGNEIGPCQGHGIVFENTSGKIERNNVLDIQGVGIFVWKTQNVAIVSNYIENAHSAIQAQGTTGNIEIDLNLGKNNAGPFPYGQLVQLIAVSGPGHKIRCNTSDSNRYGPVLTTPTIRTEDQINVWSSNGTPSDPILVAYNRLRGGGSHTGSGVMVGDGSGSWVVARGNRVVNPWNTGVSVAGGNNITIEFNKIFTDNPTEIIGEGMYIRNFSDRACFNITHNSNQLKWLPDDWTTAGWNQRLVVNPTNLPACTNVTGTETNNLNANLTAEIFTEPIAECRALATTRGYRITGW